jgi:hypothetical protein
VSDGSILRLFWAVWESLRVILRRFGASFYPYFYGLKPFSPIFCPRQIPHLNKLKVLYNQTLIVLIVLAGSWPPEAGS